MTYFVTIAPTPILNTPNFKEVYGQTLPFDNERLVRALEMVAFPNRGFTVISKKRGDIIEVASEGYPSSKSLYVDARFGVFQKEKPEPAKRKVPSKKIVIECLLSKLGLPYVWGGNWSTGLPDWEKWYPPPESLSPFERAHWTFKGLDCSGLLYEATEGVTPRNTQELMTYGKEISLKEIDALDLILYQGHVIIALNPNEVIESCHPSGGVVVNPLRERLKTIDQPIQIRRFC